MRGKAVSARLIAFVHIGRRAKSFELLQMLSACLFRIVNCLRRHRLERRRLLAGWRISAQHEQREPRNATVYRKTRRLHEHLHMKACLVKPCI